MSQELNNITNPYARDIFLSYLIKEAKRTQPDGYPIIEKHMVATNPPKEVYQWDCRNEVKEPKVTGMSFYCRDDKFTPILNNPHNYLEKLSRYACVIGMDASPYDNMPLVVQKSQIYTSLAITYFFGKNGLHIIPNVRLGNNDTIGILDAIPRECLIAVGTNGFIKKIKNRKIFKEQMDIVIDTLRPTGILVYGKADNHIFQTAIAAEIPLYQYDSHTMKRNAEIKKQKKMNTKAKSDNLSEGSSHER